MAYHKSIAGIGGKVYLVSGATPAQSTQMAVIKSWSLEMSQDQLELRGSALDPLDILPTKRTVKGKLSLNDFSSSLIAAVTTGTTISAGVKLGAMEEATIPATPFTVTVTNSATWTVDFGVIDRTSAKELTRVASAPATGQYSVSAGAYLFAAADVGHAVAISYQYSVASSGKTLEVAGAQGGTASSTYALHMVGTAGGKSYSIYVPAVRLPNLSLTMSPDAWSDVSVDYTAFLDSNNKLLYTYLPE